MRKRNLLIILLMIVLLLLTVPSVGAAAALPEKNDQPRHELCTALSDSAEAYYVGDYTYENLSTLSGAEDISTGYAAMQDNELFGALHTLMAQTHTYYTTYSGYNAGSLAYYWTSTDAVNSGNTYTMFYSDVVADADGIKLNREHIWPKSRASFNTAGGGADLHHLRPAVDTLNSAKSDHLFGEIVSAYPDGYTEGTVSGSVCYWVKKDADLFECKDDVKGDVARILLYVYCRWEQPNLYTDTAAELLPENDKGSTDNGKKVIESLDTLLRWCEEDPVDTWEMRRNDLTEAVQGNRNVFIDYPELAWQLFGMEEPKDMPTPTSKNRRYLGDADADGATTSLDVTMIQRYLAKLQTSSFDERLADTDGDSTVTALDATYLCRYLASMPCPEAIGKAV